MHNEKMRYYFISVPLGVPIKIKKDHQSLESLSIIGGEERIRTVDLLTASHNLNVYNNFIINT